MKILNQHQIREADQQTIALEPISSIALMVRASKACADWLVERYENKQPFWIICGTGNNGGDGFVAASKLYEKGYRVNLHSVTKGINIKGDSLQYYNKCKTHDIPVTFGLKLPKQEYPDLIVDGILGTGTRGEIDVREMT